MPALRTVAELAELLSRCEWLGPSFVQLYLGDPENAPTEGPEVFASVLVRDGLLTVFQARHLLAGTPENLILARKYKVLDVLGAGGMGQVFLCEHMGLQRRVAVKVLPLARAGNVVAVERFVREARAVAALNHPNIVRCYDLDRDGSRLFLVMEYLDGASLEAVVRHRGPLAWPRAANCIAQAARGLQHAHELGWVHRDVKPANIMLDRTGSVKLLDLGLVRLARDCEDKLTMQHNGRAILGTVDYIAPEQAVASHEVDIRADIYSLGCTLYFLLGGRPPFPGGTIADKLLWHQNRQPDSLRELQPDVPRELAVIVARMMMKEPERRYQRPADVVAALAPWTAVTLQSPAASDFPSSGGDGQLPDLSGSRGLPSTDWTRLNPLDSHGALREPALPLDRASIVTRVMIPAGSATPVRSVNSTSNTPPPRLASAGIVTRPLPEVLPLTPFPGTPPTPVTPPPVPREARPPMAVVPARRPVRRYLRQIAVVGVFVAVLGSGGWLGWKWLKPQLSLLYGPPPVSWPDRR